MTVAARGRRWRGEAGAGGHRPAVSHHPPSHTALSTHDEPEARCSVLHAVEKLEDFRAGCARTEAGVEPGHRAYALDGRGWHWILVVTATVTTVVASGLETDEHGEAHAVTVPFDAEQLSLLVTVVEID